MRKPLNEMTINEKFFIFLPKEWDMVLSTISIVKGMNSRCNPNAKITTKTKNYAGRGLRVAKRYQGKDGWMNLVLDIGFRPSFSHSLDRIDNDKGYLEGNLRWASRSVQNCNKRNSRKFTYNGKTGTLKQVLSFESKAQYDSFRRRVMDQGMTIEEALAKPLHRKKDMINANTKDTYKGLTRFQWDKKLGLKRCTIASRRHRGLSWKECVTMKKGGRSNAKIVFGFNPKKGFSYVFASGNEAVRIMGLSRSQLFYALKNGTKSCGFYWYYV